LERMGLNMLFEFNSGYSYTRLQINVPDVGDNRNRVPLEELESHPSGFAPDVERVPWVTERVLADGRWQVAPQLVVNQLARLDRRPPQGLLLLSRRQRHRLNSILRDLDPPAGVQYPMVFLNEVDANRLRLTDGVLVRVRSEAGAVIAQISRDGTLREGTAAMSHGYRYPNVNLLTSDEIFVDEICGMPLYSGIPVSIETVPSEEGSGVHSVGRAL
ncbi:MAG: molybdopterin dinucleotide binding domain-containing protein, partial [Actinomycetes bacterium]